MFSDATFLGIEDVDFDIDIWSAECEPEILVGMGSKNQKPCNLKK